MSRKHEKLLRAIFHDPITGSIHWREIEALLKHLGADVESVSGARLRVKLNGVEGVLHRPHHGNTLDRSGIQHVREYLAHARVTPALYESARAAEEPRKHP
ncbi:MAG: type II toxin-antitoxin system HicA family toxin [Burkholderiales bacterium]|nr:type II toxin-antitoxin system HicA family toxin [Burkholderiales bacterium]